MCHFDTLSTRQVSQTCNGIYCQKPEGKVYSLNIEYQAAEPKIKGGSDFKAFPCVYSLYGVYVTARQMGSCF